MKKSTLILIGAVVLIGIFAVSAYNGLVNKQEQLHSEWAQSRNSIPTPFRPYS